MKRAGRCFREVTTLSTQEGKKEQNNSNIMKENIGNKKNISTVSDKENVLPTTYRNWDKGVYLISLRLFFAIS